jgi:hypothetical protein
VFARKWGEAVLGLVGVGLSRLMWNRKIVVDMTVAVGYVCCGGYWLYP